MTFQKYFGLRESEMTDEDWRAVNDAIQTRTADSGWYDYVSPQAVKVKTQVWKSPGLMIGSAPAW